MDESRYEQLCINIIGWSRRLIRHRSDRATKKIAQTETLIAKAKREILSAGLDLPVAGMPRRKLSSKPRKPRKPSNSLLFRKTHKYFSVVTTGTTKRLIGPYAYYSQLHEHLEEQVLRARRTGRFTPQLPTHWEIDVSTTDVSQLTKYVDDDYFNNSDCYERELSMEELETRMRNGEQENEQT